MKDSIKQLIEKITPVINLFKRYMVFIFIIAVLGVYGFLVVRVNMLTNASPSATDVEEQLQTVKRPKIDETTIQKISELEDNSAPVKALLNQGRKNPFQE